jgi:hypothetical protein
VIVYRGVALLVSSVLVLIYARALPGDHGLDFLLGFRSAPAASFVVSPLKFFC